MERDALSSTALPLAPPAPSTAPCAPGVAERHAAWALDGPLTIAVGLLCLLMLACWIPHYLTWPWWVDLDDFALFAQAWDAGILPYRDILGGSFPGPTYLLWALGKAFGWGRTAPILALDAGFVALLGAALAAWSRRVFGRILPGLIGYAAFLSYYLNLDYSQVVQRDWQAPFFAVLALMALEALPSRASRVASALLFAVAVAFRPHVVLFLPATALALDEGARGPGDRWSATARAILEWGAAFAVSLVLVFSPLILAGVVDDFYTWFLKALGGAKGHKSTLRGILISTLSQLRVAKYSGVALMLALGAAGLQVGRARRVTLTWLVALLGLFLYKPVHPIPHFYLAHPLALTWAVCMAVLVHMIGSSFVSTPLARLFVYFLLLIVAVPEWPRFCKPGVSLRSLPLLARGEEPPFPPPGYTKYSPLGFAAHYPWEDYRNALDHLRRTTRPQTRVANLLKAAPAVTGPIGRLSAFDAEAGIRWTWEVDPAWEATFAQQLERATDSVVVWDPQGRVDGPWGALPLVEPVVLRFYAPEARFGIIEIWRRTPSTGPARGPEH